jgi:hypothetical protein
MEIFERDVKDGEGGGVRKDQLGMENGDLGIGNTDLEMSCSQFPFSHSNFSIDLPSGVPEGADRHSCAHRHTGSAWAELRATSLTIQFGAHLSGLNANFFLAMGHFNRINGIDFEEPRSSGYPNMLAQLARMVVLLFLASLFFVFSVDGLDAATRTSAQKPRHKSAATHYPHHYSPSRKAVGISRDNHGKIKRSQVEKKKFLKRLGYRRVPPGYEVDHIIPLSKGGADKSYNMQLIPKSVHKRKTAAERRHK